MSYTAQPKFTERFTKSAPAQAVAESPEVTGAAPTEPYSFFGERFLGGRAKPFREAASSLATFSNPENLTAFAVKRLNAAGIVTFPVPDAASPDSNPNLHYVVVNVMDKEKAKAVLDVMDPNWLDTAASTASTGKQDVI
jgi:hypothetical protein